MSAGALVAVAAYLCANPYGAFVLIGVYVLALQSINGPVLAAIQTLVPQSMRAVAFALIYLVANLIGMGLGPLIAGALSDALHPWVGEESLRYALVILSPGFFWAAWHAWRAGFTIESDLADCRADSAPTLATASPPLPPTAPISAG